MTIVEDVRDPAPRPHKGLTEQDSPLRGGESIRHARGTETR